MEKKRCTAVILAAGSGSRMQSEVPKQFMTLEGKPLICYALYAAEMSAVIDDCILVVRREDRSYVAEEIVERYGFQKVAALSDGGAERWRSVCSALRAMERDDFGPAKEGYVFIHDGARPFLTEEILQDTYEAVQKYRACVAAVPSKDTVKIADEEGFSAATPDRRLVWNVQTPQVFERGLITEAYERLAGAYEAWRRDPRGEEPVVTDDAGVVEKYTDVKVKLVPASYRNIKITTPEDIAVARAWLR
ncbi:MAG: 2-C-methyl-D-erythritol 4-phosphate cytidylyltransferase [Candidatus Gastranaerophilales bacterium]|nr:2-C-methyl-D-erythritol 4-phosphate cytidylyltransferase [Candidatus Gastranaerophilales bacterium]